MLRAQLASPRLVGVLGWPLDHTLSPVIQNAAFRRLALEWIYLSFPTRPQDLAAAVGGLRALGAMGANVTMPHKEEVMGLLDDLSGDARAVGAVNTIQRVGDDLIGHNTDIDGFAEFVVGDAGYDVTGMDCIVLGSGGAARAVVKALDDLGAGRIAIVARRTEAAARLVGLVGGGRADLHPWESAAELVTASDVVVNATPVGMGREDVVPAATFRAGQLVVDLIYEPPSTPMVERARTAGADAWGGLGMLVHQAAASFRIWTGQDPPIGTMSAAAVRAIGSHQ
jgi:shikimate dehydrogenase